MHRDSGGRHSHRAPDSKPERSPETRSLIYDERGIEQFRMPDIPFQSGAGSVAYQESITFAKAMPTHKMIARLVTFDEAGGERLLGEYAFNHTRSLPGPGAW